MATNTGDDLQIDFQWNGQAGDEALMVQKIRVGQLDGAVVSAMGLAQTGVTDALIFQLPGLFRDASQVDSVRTAVSADLDKEFLAQGFVVLGWGNAGPLRSMSIGYEVRHPQDLRGKGAFFIAGDPVAPALYTAIGGITPRTLAVTDILPGLASGSITFLVSSALLAEQLQWASRITHVGADASSFALGGFLASAPRMKALSERFKQVMAARGADLQGHLDPVVRSMDEQAFARMKATKTVYSLTDAEKSEWKTFSRRPPPSSAGRCSRPPSSTASSSSRATRRPGGPFAPVVRRESASVDRERGCPGERLVERDPESLARRVDGREVVLIRHERLAAVGHGRRRRRRRVSADSRRPGS